MHVATRKLATDLAPTAVEAHTPGREVVVTLQPLAVAPTDGVVRYAWQAIVTVDAPAFYDRVVARGDGQPRLDVVVKAAFAAALDAYGAAS